MRLPNAEHATVDRRKLVDYLLARSHPMGCSKAIWFEAFGFSAENWRQLAAALAEHARRQPVVSSTETPYGAKFIVEGPLPSPDGRDPRVRSVWFVRREEESPRFVTAYRAGGGET